MTIKHQLSSGVRLALDPMENVGSVTLGIWVGVGARAEPAHHNGMAHFLEHMAFKGTKSRDALAIAREIEDVGGIINAWTSRECTSYYARVLSEHGELALRLLTDILFDSVFDKKEMERERGVILQEIGMATDTPEDVVWDNFQATAFPNQAIGRPILGTKDIINSVQRETMQEFISHHYKAKQMVVSIAGKINVDEMIALAEELFAPWDNNPAPSMTKADYQGGDHQEEKKLEQSHVLQGMQAPSYTDDLFFPCLACANIYGGGMASRLFQEIREKRGLAYHVSSFYQPYRDNGLFGFYAGTSHERVTEVRTVAKEILLAMGDAITDEELKRAQEVMRAGILMSQESTAARADRMAQQWLIYDDIFPVEESIKRIQAIQKDDIGRCIAMLTQSQPTISVLGEKI